MWLGRGASQKKKKNSMPNFRMTPATRRGAGSHERWGSMAGGLTPTTTARPMRPDGLRCEPMATAQTPATTPPIHPHWRPSAGGRREGSWRGGGDVPNHPLRHPPNGRSIGSHLGLSNTPRHHPPSTPIDPSKRIGFFRIAGHIAPHPARGRGMTGGGCGRGLARACLGRCD